MVNSQARRSPSGRRSRQRDSARSSVSCTRSSARVVVAQQRVGVAAQRRDQRFEQGVRVGHRFNLTASPAPADEDRRRIHLAHYLAMCQAPFRKPSPVVSPALVSLTKA